LRHGSKALSGPPSLGSLADNRQNRA